MKTPRLSPPSTRPTALSAAAAATTAAALLLGGCGSSADQADQDGSAKGKSAKSPLEKYLGYSPNEPGTGGGGMVAVSMSGAEKLSDADKARMRRVQELIAKCMRKEGFEYVPEAPPKDDDAGGGDKGVGSLSPEEYAKKYGYGITTLDQIAPVAGDDDDGSPNDRIRAKLSKDARTAYDEALWGKGSSGDGGMTVTRDMGDADESPSKDSSTEQSPGCEGTANEKIYGKPEKFDPKSQDALFEDLDALRKRIQGDPKVKEAEKAYADCLADAGHPDFKKPGDAQESVWKKYTDLMESSQSSGNQPDEGEGDEGGPMQMDPSKVDPAKLAPIKQLELSLAPTDLECRSKHYDSAYRDVQIPMEKEFVAQHKDELERHQDAMGEAGGGLVVSGPRG